MATETTTSEGPLTLNVYNVEGQAVGTVQVDPAEFGGAINKQLLHEVVVMYLANQRAGTHSTLRRGEVAGSTKKLFRQTGTGNARVGTKRTNKRRGGGTAKGPKPRDYEYHLPKKVKKAGLRAALSLRAKEQKVIVLDAFTVAAPKLTKQVASVLAALGAGKALVIDGGNELLARGAKNLPRTKWLAPEGLNVYDVLKYDTLIITAPSAKQVEEALKP